MPDTIQNCTLRAKELENLSQEVLAAEVSDEKWKSVETTAHRLANSLRVIDESEDIHTALGDTQLPTALNSLLKSCLGSSPVPKEPRIPPVFELLRVAANLCMNHDRNRGHLLEAAFPQSVVSLLEGYVELINSKENEEPPLPISHLKVIRTSVGVLLNASVGYDPVKDRLNSLEAGLTILKISAAVYKPASWIKTTPQPATDEATFEESWMTRSGISNWASRALLELKGDKEESTQVFHPDVLPYLVPSLRAFIPPFETPPENSHFASDNGLRRSLIQADFSLVEENCTLLESLVLDVENIRLSLARGFKSPAEHGGVPCLAIMLDFVEKGTYHPLWKEDLVPGETERKKREKALDICKAAMVKAIVEVAGEEKSCEVLWDDSEEANPGGPFVGRMVRWMNEYVEQTGGRDDLVICATLSLGNLARKATMTKALLSPPHSLSPLLASDRLLGPAVDVQLKHGVIGLLRNLAQSSTQMPEVQAKIGESGVIQKLIEGGVWDAKIDAMAEVVQLGAIGVVKHLCNGNVQNSILLVDHPKEVSTLSGMKQILALVKRSDSVPLKSEGTRVLVNVIKSLWVADPKAEKEQQKKKEMAVRELLNEDSTTALVQLLCRSAKYPQLINESVFALTLLAIHKEGATLVLNTLWAEQPEEISAQTKATLASEKRTSTDKDVAHRRGVGMLVSALKNKTSGPPIPPEIRANVCFLLHQLTKNCEKEKLTELKKLFRPVLQELVAEGVEQLALGAKIVLGMWDETEAQAQ